MAGVLLLLHGGFKGRCLAWSCSLRLPTGQREANVTAAGSLTG